MDTVDNARLAHHTGVWHDQMGDDEYATVLAEAARTVDAQDCACRPKPYGAIRCQHHLLP